MASPVASDAAQASRVWKLKQGSHQFAYCSHDHESWSKAARLSGTILSTAGPINHLADLDSSAQTKNGPPRWAVFVNQLSYGGGLRPQVHKLTKQVYHGLPTNQANRKCIMPTKLSAEKIGTITTTLAPVRLATFQLAIGFSIQADALEKYRWHALTSAAFFSSLHVCEVAVRNGVDAALAATYGPDWPWNSTFEHSLPNPRGSHFKPQDELRRARAKMAIGATGKVIAELKFAFWCHTFTSRYQVRVWDSHIRNAFPNLPDCYSAASGRQAIHTELDSLRKFRNRIAHHEPILAEPLPQRQQSIQRLIHWRCAEVSAWHATWEIVSQIWQPNHESRIEATMLTYFCAAWGL